jgi:hypothetical protein
MFRQINFSEANKIRQEIEKEYENLKELEKKRDKVREEKEQIDRETPEKLRQAYLGPNSQQKIAELTREIQTSNCTYQRDIVNLNSDIRTTNAKIFQKQDQLNALVGIR